MLFPEEVIHTLVQNAHRDASGDNLYGDCPYCGGDEFGISLEDNHLFRCFRGKECGTTGNIFTLLKFLGKTELYKDKDFYKETDVFKPLEQRTLSQGSKEVDMSLPDVSIPLGWRRMVSNDYLESRGFTSAQFNKYEVGQSKILTKFKDYVIFVIRQDSGIKGYVARNILSKDTIDAKTKLVKDWNKANPTLEPKRPPLRYSNSSQTDFSKIVYGIDEVVKGITTTIIIVEGLFDKINLEIICPDLFSDKTIVVVCTWGKKISPSQMAKIKECSLQKAILLYDPDAINDSKRYSFELSHIVPEVEVGYLDEKDPGDLNSDEFYEVMMNLKSPTEFNLDFLQKRTL